MTAAMGLDGFPHGAASAAWADYDRDGYLDLLVVLMGESGTWASHQLKLLRNTPKAGGGREFTDVTVAAGLDGAGSYSLTPLWADFDRDGHLDLVMLTTDGDHGSHRYFVNQGDGTFVDQAQQRMPGIDGLTAVAGLAALADIDGDGHLDIVFANNSSGNSVGYLLNDGEGNFPAAKAHTFTMGAFVFARDLDVLDYDLDGRPDLLVTNADERTLLLANRVLLTEPELVDVTQAVRLGAVAPIAAAVAADFNLDGFTDLYLCRPVQSGHFFYKAGEGAEQSNWVGIRLVSEHGANNYLGIGATVTVMAGADTLTQIVDGGSGRAGQQEAGLVFGLGDKTGTVSATVRWPTGRLQHLAVQPNQYNTIVDDPPVVSESWVSAYVVYHMGTGEQDWVFEWQTTSYTQAEWDKVTIKIDGLPQRCVPELTTLTPDMPEVEHVAFQLLNFHWLHRLTWRNVQCEPNCTIPFEVHSGVGQYRTKSEGDHTLRIRTCLQSM